MTLGDEPWTKAASWVVVVPAIFATVAAMTAQFGGQNRPQDACQEVHQEAYQPYQENLSAKPFTG